MTNERVERRGSQRIVTNLVGKPRFFLSWYGGRIALEDLSIEGFSMAMSTPPASERPFEFLIEREATQGGVSGQAQIVNFSCDFKGGLVGCKFVDLSEDGHLRIADWLADHVLDVAAVRVTADDAEDIVLGPSIV